MKDTTKLARSFLESAQLLADHMLTDLAQRDPGMAKSVAAAAEHGEPLSLAFVFDRAASRIELDSRSDYGSRRLIASIPLQSVAGKRRN